MILKFIIFYFIFCSIKLYGIDKPDRNHSFVCNHNTLCTLCFKMNLTNNESCDMQRLSEIRCFQKYTADNGRIRIAATPQVGEQMIHEIEENPTASSRKFAANLDVSRTDFKISKNYLSLIAIAIEIRNLLHARLCSTSFQFSCS